jgi:hypothetical protein
VRKQHTQLQAFYEEKQNEEKKEDEEKKDPEEEEREKKSKIKTKLNEVWKTIFDQLDEKVYFCQVETLQINVLNLLCSNFWIATQTIQEINEFLKSMNRIYNTRVSLGE